MNMIKMYGKPIRVNKVWTLLNQDYELDQDVRQTYMC